MVLILVASAAKECQKGAKQNPNGIKTSKMDPEGHPKGAKCRPWGGQDHPKDVSREGSANRVAKKTLHRTKVSSKWVQNGTIFGAMWRISGSFFRCFFKVVFWLIPWWFWGWFLMDFGTCFRSFLDPFLDPLNLWFLTTVPWVSSILPCKIHPFFSLVGYFFYFDFCVDFLMYFGCILDQFWTPFGPQMSPQNGQKSFRKIASKKGGSREVRRRRGEAELGSRRSNYQRGLDIKKVQLFEEWWKGGRDIRRTVEKEEWLGKVTRRKGGMFYTLTRWVGGFTKTRQYMFHRVRPNTSFYVYGYGCDYGYGYVFGYGYGHDYGYGYGYCSRLWLRLRLCLWLWFTLWSRLRWRFSKVVVLKGWTMIWIPWKPGRLTCLTCTVTWRPMVRPWISSSSTTCWKWAFMTWHTFARTRLEWLWMEAFRRTDLEWERVGLFTWIRMSLAAPLPPYVCACFYPSAAASATIEVHEVSSARLQEVVFRSRIRFDAIVF